MFCLLSNSGESHAWNPVTSLFVLKIDFSPNIDEVAVTSLKHRSLSQKRLKPSPGNSNVHRERDLDTEPSPSKILRDKDSAYAYCFIYVSRSRLDLDRWGPSPLPKKGAERLPQFSAHVYCGKTAGWIKMAFGMEVGLGPGHIVLDGVPASAKGAYGSPLFSVHVYCGHGRPSQLLLSCCPVLPCTSTSYLRWHSEASFDCLLYR